MNVNPKTPRETIVAIVLNFHSVPPSPTVAETFSTHAPFSAGIKGLSSCMRWREENRPVSRPRWPESVSSKPPIRPVWSAVPPTAIRRRLTTLIRRMPATRPTWLVCARAMCDSDHPRWCDRPTTMSTAELPDQITESASRRQSVAAAECLCAQVSVNRLRL